MKKLSLLALVLMLSAVNAFAVSLEFQFDVNSSSASIYPCDAGIKHANHGGSVCYDRVTQNSCDPAACTNTNECNCVCTGGIASNGQEKLDMIQAKYADWSENGSYAPSSVQSVVVNADSNNFARIFSWKNEWAKQLTSLSFNLGSERYGTEFYLDVCYRGPQIEYYEAFQQAGQNTGYPSFYVQNQATVTDLISSNGLKYSQLADLKVKSEVICDVQGAGQYIYARDLNGNYDNVFNADDMMFGNSVDKYFTSNNYVSFNGGSVVQLLWSWINEHNANVPRFCKVRYSFIENKRNDGSNPLSTIRKWSNQKARICTYTNINEG